MQELNRFGEMPPADFVPYQDYQLKSLGQLVHEVARTRVRAERRWKDEDVQKSGGAREGAAIVGAPARRQSWTAAPPAACALCVLALASLASSRPALSAPWCDTCALAWPCEAGPAAVDGA